MERKLPVLELQYVDSSGTKGATTVRFPLDTTVAFMEAQAIALASLIAPITGCVLIRQRIIYKAVEIPKPDADDGSYIFRSGVLFFDCGTDNPLELITVPALSDAVLLTDGPTADYGIDLTNSDVVAVFDAMLALDCTNVFGDAITELIAGYIQSRS